VTALPAEHFDVLDGGRIRREKPRADARRLTSKGAGQTENGDRAIESSRVDQHLSFNHADLSPSRFPVSQSSGLPVPRSATFADEQL
jgi:hypothetical protein